ncbi:cob(I)yrinic acid a,c-diamide adenosyltransferase [bacterium]|nr:cob(I)yrinic acid a,c-diamide adenosyltransferase [bacterium]|tara:strand:+ start:2317 stop:2841 length:525 start_codon:yes stop_codon:yes gene_type:complete
MLIIITGNGKGKTTSSIGQGIRALGQGKRVAMFQFIKSKTYPSGEDEILKKKFGKKFLYVKGGKGFVGILGDKLPKSVHKKAAQDTFEKGRRAMQGGKYDLVILDELWVALYLKLLTKAQVQKLIKSIPEDMDVILTGRYAPKEFINQADLATECKEIKHPYQKGTRARKGVEY